MLRYLRQVRELDGRRVALWGDSFSRVNPAGRDLKVAHTAASRPAQSEPLGGLLALLGGLFEDVRAVYVRGGLSDYHSVLQGAFCYLPHDAVVPGVLATGDLCDVAAALAPGALRLEGLGDGLNREVSVHELTRRYAPALRAYETAGRKDRLLLNAKSADSAAFTRWLTAQLLGKE